MAPASTESVRPATGTGIAARFAFESVLIVLSILLAFVLNEWREERRDATRRLDASARIASELRHNIGALDSVTGYHADVVARVGALLDSTGVAAVRAELSAPPTLSLLARVAPSGLRPPDLRSAAWRSAEMSGALSLFEAELLQEVAGAYQNQTDGVLSAVNRLSDNLLAPEQFARPGRLLLQYMQLEVGEIVARERYLRDVLARAATSLEASSR